MIFHFYILLWTIHIKKTSYLTAFYIMETLCMKRQTFKTRIYFRTALPMCPIRSACMSPGFHPSTFCYYRFSLEIEFKIQLGVLGCCKLWLKQHSDLLKPLEMALFFSCDEWYSYCIITSNSCSHILLNIFDCFSKKNYGNDTIDEKFVGKNLP